MQKILNEIRVRVVGKNHYQAKLKVGEEVLFKREYDNPFDKNAMAVVNFDGERVGYLRKELMAELAPYLDDEQTFYVLDGICVDNRNNYYDLIDLKFIRVY